MNLLINILKIGKEFGKTIPEGNVICNKKDGFNQLIYLENYHNSASR